MDEYASEDWSALPAHLLKAEEKARMMFEKSVMLVKEGSSEEVTAFHARRLVEMATEIIVSWLLLRDARRSARKLAVAETFMEKMLARAMAHATYIQSEDACFMKNYKDILNLE
jgi:hypothetical protein